MVRGKQATSCFLYQHSG